MNPRSLLQLATLAANNADNHPRGLGEVNILNDLYVHSGSVVEWSGELLLADGARVERPNPANAQQVANDFAAMLYTGGWFSDVQVSYFGWFSVSFTARVTTGVDFGRLSDLRSIFEGVAWQTSTSGWPHLAAQTSNLYVVSVPRGVVITNPRQPATIPAGRGSNTTGGGLPNALPPVQQSSSVFCDNGFEWNWSKFGCVPVGAQGSSGNVFDSLASWLGVTPTQAVVVGALGAVLAVVAIKRVL